MPAQNTVVHTQANEAPDERAYDALAVHDGYTVGDSLEAVEVYVRSIRNRSKRTYAERVLRNLRNGWEAPNNAPCSIMARQAVDMRIANIRREAQ